MRSVGSKYALSVLSCRFQVSTAVAGDPGLLGYDTVAGLTFHDVVKEFSTFIFNPKCLEVKALLSLEM
jgi:hypothetical protein